MFVFCIFVSAATCGLVVSSRDILRELDKIFKLRRTTSVHRSRRLSHEYDSGEALSESKPERVLAKVGPRFGRGGEGVGGGAGLAFTHIAQDLHIVKDAGLVFASLSSKGF